MNKEARFIDLQDLSNSITDCHHSTPKFTESGKIVIRNFNIKNGRLLLDNKSYTDEENFKQRTSRAKPEPGDLIITREAPMGEVCIIPDGVECCLGQRMVLIKPNPKKISNKFLLYSLMSTYCQTQIKKSEGTGSIVSNLRIPVLKELPIPYLSFGQQQKIGNLLSQIDDKIEINNKINAELEGMAKLIYDYWFVQFDFPYDFTQDKPADETSNPKDIKPYKSSGGKMVRNQELNREIPDGWEVNTLNSIVNFNPSLSIPNGKEAAYIDMNALPESGFITKGPQKKEFHGGVKFQNRDVIIARITPCLENGKTGLVSLLRNDNDIGFGSTEFIVLRGKKENIPSFLAFLSRSELFRKYSIMNMTGTSGRKRVDAKSIAEFKLSIPPLILFNSFEEKIWPLFKKMTLLAKQNQELSALRDWLLPMLMNGQVRIDDQVEKKYVVRESEVGMAAEPGERYGVGNPE